MNEITETTSKEAATEYKTFVTPNFHEVAEEIAKHAAYGWKLDPQRPPFYNFFLYEVHMLRSAQSVAAAKEKLSDGEGAREPITKEKRQAIMAKAREARKNKIAEKDGDSGDE